MILISVNSGKRIRRNLHQSINTDNLFVLIFAEYFCMSANSLGKLLEPDGSLLCGRPIDSFPHVGIPRVGLMHQGKGNVVTVLRANNPFQHMPAVTLSFFPRVSRQL